MVTLLVTDIVSLLNQISERLGCEVHVTDHQIVVNGTSHFVGGRGTSRHDFRVEGPLQSLAETNRRRRLRKKYGENFKSPTSGVVGNICQIGWNPKECWEAPMV